MSKHLVIAGHGMQRNGRFDPGATGIIRKVIIFLYLNSFKYFTYCTINH